MLEMLHICSGLNSMLCVGFSFQKGRFRLAVLERTGAHIQVNVSRATPIDPKLPYCELMDRYASHFRSVKDEFKPGVMAARQSWESSSLDAAIFQITPLGLLGCVAHAEGVPLIAYTPQALRQGTSFGLAKGSNPLAAVDGQFGSYPPHWDDMQKYAVLVAWRALLEIP
jgi:hypothetical protein